MGQKGSKSKSGGKPVAKLAATSASAPATSRAVSAKTVERAAPAAAPARPAAQGVKHTEHPPRVGDTVQTPYGHGTVVDFREDGLVEVTMDWVMAQGAKVHAFMNLDSVHVDAEHHDSEDEAEGEDKDSVMSAIKKVLKNSDGSSASAKRVRAASASALLKNVFAPGTMVETPYGPGVVRAYRRTDGFYECLLGWELADGLPPVAFLQPNQLSRRQLMPEGSFVSTQYGTGELVDFRPQDGAHVVVLRQLQGEAVGYLQPDAIEAEPIAACISSKVHTTYGHGIVIGYRAKGDLYEVALQFGIAFLQRDTIERVLDEDEAVDVSGVKECVIS